MRGHLGAAKDDKSIMTRLTPGLVLECGGITSSDVISSVDVSSPSYTLLYRIWGNHQKMSFQNKDMGFLEIQKSTVEDKLLFNIKKLLVNYDNLNQHIDISLTTMNNDLHTPLEYDYSSRITDSALCTRGDLSLDRKGVIENNHITETIKGIDYRREFSGRLVCDFTIYDIVSSGITVPDFTYYENLYSFKQNNKLINCNQTYSFAGQDLKMVIQLGTALTERIFYINKHNIPIMMIQNSVVYILDNHAKQAAELLIEQLNTGGVHYEY